MYKNRKHIDSVAASILSTLTDVPLAGGKLRAQPFERTKLPRMQWTLPKVPTIRRPRCSFSDPYYSLILYQTRETSFDDSFRARDSPSAASRRQGSDLNLELSCRYGYAMILRHFRYLASPTFFPVRRYFAKKHTILTVSASDDVPCAKLVLGDKSETRQRFELPTAMALQVDDTLFPSVVL